ncbi:MAG: MBL fold metallo-hydrolase [Oligoflexales bacterium]|nr:MBL fold metallo-hydrolase [Oligoflexales bacterium]
MEFKVSTLEGNRQSLDGGAMFGNAPRTMWEQWIQPDELGRIELACRCLLLEFPGEKILLETGIGAYMDPKIADRYGVQRQKDHVLLESLNRLGVSPKEITTIILSHLHFDHAGGCLNAFQGAASPISLAFPSARFVVSRGAWERARSPHFRDRASFIPGLTELLQKKTLIIIEAGQTSHPDLYPELLNFFTSDGHTPGHLHTVINGAKEKIVFCGDLVPGLAWLHLPITMGYDRFPELVIDEKRKFYQRALAESWHLFYTHDAKTAMSQVALDEKQRFVSKDARAALVRHAV